MNGQLLIWFTFALVALSWLLCLGYFASRLLPACCLWPFIGHFILTLLLDSTARFQLAVLGLASFYSGVMQAGVRFIDGTKEIVMGCVVVCSVVCCVTYVGYVVCLFTIVVRWFACALK